MLDKLKELLNNDYTIKFKATRKLFNLIKIRYTHAIYLTEQDYVESEVSAAGVNAGVNHQLDNDYSELEFIEYVVNEYSKIENLTNVKLISYTRFA